MSAEQDLQAQRDIMHQTAGKIFERICDEFLQ